MAQRPKIEQSLVSAMPETEGINQSVPSLQEATKIEAPPVQAIIEAPPVTALIACTRTCDQGHEL